MMMIIIIIIIITIFIIIIVKTMAAVRSFEELAVQKGRHSIIKDAKKYAEELDLRTVVVKLP